LDQDKAAGSSRSFAMFRISSILTCAALTLSLGAVRELLTWLYVTGIMLLLGAEVNMVIEVAAVRAHAVPLKDKKKDIFDEHPPIR
jgi:uncharacterized BrkB/YihY/UPF0761 family membrane protein